MVPQCFHCVDGHDGDVMIVLFPKSGIAVNIGFHQGEAVLAL